MSSLTSSTGIISCKLVACTGSISLQNIVSTHCLCRVDFGALVGAKISYSCTIFILGYWCLSIAVNTYTRKQKNEAHIVTIQSQVCT